MSSKKAASKKEMKPVAAKAPAVSKKQSLSSAYLKSYAAMMTNPKDSEPVRTPSEFATVGDVKVFQRVFPLTAAGSVGNNFSMVAQPTIENFFQLTRNVGITSPNPMDAADPNYLVWVINQLTGKIEATGTFTITDHVTQVVLGSVETTDFNGKNALILSVPPLSGLTMRLTNGPAAGVFTMYYWDPILLAWTLGAAQSIGGYQTAGLTIAPVNGVGAIAIECSRSPSKCVANISAPVGSAFSALAQSYNLFNSDAVQLAGIERYRVCAMSILAQYSGNQFNDGGVIAGARCQPGYTYGADPYTSLSKLVDHTYHGPMKTGAYVWWLPNSFAEREYTPVGDAPPSATNLRIAGQFSDPDGSLQITVTVVVEFYSPFQVWNHNLGPVVSDEFYAVIHALDSIPAATCNPLHKDLLKLVSTVARKGVQFAVQNPQIVAAALKSLASML